MALEQGEFVRLSITTDGGHLRARVVGPQRQALQTTWISAFSLAAPSPGLAFAAPDSGLYVIELSVPTWAQFAAAQSFRVELLHRDSAAVAAARHRELVDDPRVAMLRRHAQPIRSIDPRDDDFSDLEFLRAPLGRVRVVLLGEADNGGGSDVLAKTRFVRFLHEQMGFDVLVFQAGIHSARAAWHALRSGMDPREAMMKGVLGVLTRSAEAGPLCEYLSARARTDTPLEVAGFDSQLTGTAGGTFLLELQRLLEGLGLNSPFRDNQAEPTRILTGLLHSRLATDPQAPSSAQQAETIERLRALSLELDRRAENRDAVFWAQVLRSTATQLDLGLKRRRGGTETEFMAGFFRQMSDNLQWLVTTGHAKRKVVVWTHTRHILRDAKVTAQGRNVGVGVGQGLAEALGQEYFAIGLTSYNGASHWVTQPDEYVQDVIPNQHPAFSFETLMAAADHRLAWINLREARTRGDWLGGAFVANALYLVPEEAEWSHGLDALLFIRTQQPRQRFDQSP